jgi:RNA polymerase sigma-70 factor (ECF subfamily)
LTQEKSTTLLPAADPDEVSPRRELLARLVRRMQDGDGQALECFIQETQQVAWRLAFSLLRDRHRAEDCLQDVYFTVYRSVHQLRDPYAAQTWLLRIVTHRCRRLLRSRPAASLEELAESGIEPAAPERLGMEQALARLGPQDREVLTLREMMQLSYEEIAQGLQIPLGTVRSRLAKARQRFVQALTGKGREGSR